MGIRASYWATGGILAVLGLAVARVILGFIGGVALALVAFLLKATLVVLAGVMIWLVVRWARRPRGAAAS